MSPLKRITVKTRRGVVVVVALAAIAMPVATWIAAARVNRNCDGIHKIVVVGAEIIAGGRADLEAYYREGTITRAQRDRAVAQLESRLARWRSADCR